MVIMVIMAIIWLVWFAAIIAFAPAPAVFHQLQEILWSGSLLAK